MDVTPASSSFEIESARILSHLKRTLDKFPLQFQHLININGEFSFGIDLTNKFFLTGIHIAGFSKLYDTKSMFT